MNATQGLYAAMNRHHEAQRIKINAVVAARKAKLHSDRLKYAKAKKLFVDLTAAIDPLFANECVVCMAAEASASFIHLPDPTTGLSIAHKCCCVHCAQEIMEHKMDCPTCRGEIITIAVTKG